MKFLDEINLEYGLEIPSNMWTRSWLSELQEVEMKKSYDELKKIFLLMLEDAQKIFDDYYFTIKDYDFKLKANYDIIDDLKNKIEKLKNERKEFLENAYADLCVEALKHGLK